VTRLPGTASRACRAGTRAGAPGGAAPPLRGAPAARGHALRVRAPCVRLLRPAVLTRGHAARRPKELAAMVKGDSYWGNGSAAEVVKTDKKGKKAPAAGAAAKGAKGVKVGKKGAKGARAANKDPKVLKAQQAAKQLLAAKKVRALRTPPTTRVRARRAPMRAPPRVSLSHSLLRTRPARLSWFGCVWGSGASTPAASASGSAVKL